MTIDVLRRAGAEVTVASAEEQLRVDACEGMKIVADALISDYADTAFDLIALPVRVQYASPASLRSLLSVHGNRLPVGAVRLPVLAD